MNDWLHSSPVAWETVAAGSILVFLTYGFICTFTDKLGFGAGDA